MLKPDACWERLSYSPQLYSDHGRLGYKPFSAMMKFIVINGGAGGVRLPCTARLTGVTVAGPVVETAIVPAGVGVVHVPVAVNGFKFESVAAAL